MSSEIDNSSTATPVTSPVSQRPASKLQLSSLARIVKAQVSLLASNLTKENYSKIAPDIQSVCVCTHHLFTSSFLFHSSCSSSIHTGKIFDSILYVFYSWILVDNMMQAATAMTMTNLPHFYCSKAMSATPSIIQVQKLSLHLLKHSPAFIDPTLS